MERETQSNQNELNESPQEVQLNAVINSFGLSQKIDVSTIVSRKGTQLISLNAGKEHTYSVKEIDTALNSGKFSDIVRVIARAFPGPEQDTSAIDLLNREAFKTATLSEVVVSNVQQGNHFLNEVSGMPSSEVPVFYGSTDGLNLAEVWETALCAQSLTARGVPSYVLFDTGGHETRKANEMLVASERVIPTDKVDQFEAFKLSLGQSITQQRLNAAQLLTSSPLSFVTHEEIFKVVENELTIGKMALLARLTGGDPKIFQNLKHSQLMQLLDEHAIEPQALIPDIQDEPAGFAMYAREALIAAEGHGHMAIPLKLTTHGNIYKLLERYGSLASQRPDGGTILCPITRHRIQTRGQALVSADPCDVLVLAFLSQEFPDQFATLKSDFENTCTVLTAEQAIDKGTVDKRFIVEDYFPL